MKKEKIRDEFDIQGSSILSDEIMEKIAEILDEELTADLERYAKMDVEIPPEHDRKMLEMARRCDRERVRAKRRTACRKAVRVAAVFLVVMLALGGIGMSSSEAFRMRVFNLFENKEDGAVILRGETDAEILDGWEDYWYPTYLPEGYYLLDAEDDSLTKFLLFKSSDDSREIRLLEDQGGGSLAVDMDTNECEKINNGDYEIYVFHDQENSTRLAIWSIGEQRIRMYLPDEEDNDTICKIATNLKHVEK